MYRTHKVISVLLLIAMVVGIIPTFQSAYAADIPDDVTTRVTLSEDGAGMMSLTYQGEAKLVTMIQYTDDNGKRQPVYCIDPSKDGVWELGSYDVDFALFRGDPKVYGIVMNGYPYKTPAELGTADDATAYYATKMALWTHILGRNVNLWAVNTTGDPEVDARRAGTLNTLKQIYAAGMAYSGAVGEYPTTTVSPSGGTLAVDGKDNTMFSQTYTVTATTEIKSYKVDLTNAPTGAIVADENNNPKTTFNDGEKFKVLVPKANVEGESGSFKLDIEAEAVNKAMFQATDATRDPNNTQRYIATVDPVYTANATATVNYQGEEPDPDPTPTPTTSPTPTPTPTPTPDPTPSPTSEPTPEPPPPPSEVTIQKLEYGTNNPLGGAVFEILDHMGGIVGSYVTDASGTVVVELEEGAYGVTELVPPDGYQLDWLTYHQDIHVQGGKEASLVFVNYPKGTIVVTKVDGDTGVPLAGATLRVALDDGTQSWDIVTGGDGTATLPDMPDGTYSVTEIVPPPGYLLDGASHFIKLVDGAGGVITISDFKQPTLVLKKLDAKTGQPLAGAVIDVEKIDGGRLTGSPFTTGADGTVIIEGCESGNYIAKEVTPPDGYAPADPNYLTFTLKPGESYTLTFHNFKNPKITILKYDQDTMELLPNAQFSVVSDDDRSHPVFEGVTDADGKIVIENLPSGSYTITEVSPPPGYVITDNTTLPNPRFIQVKPGDDITVKFDNKRVPSLTIIKRDKDTSELLAGGVFEIEKIGDPNAGKITGSPFTTEANGKVVLPELAPGSYKITEIVPPPGYNLSDPSYQIIEMLPGQDNTVTFENRRKPTLTIIKTDEITGAPLAGAKFDIEKIEEPNKGKLTDNPLVTDANGKIVIPDLLSGSYKITEVSPPNNYLMPNPNEWIIIMKDNEDYTLQIQNILLPTIVITKKDDLTEKPLPGAVFKIEYEKVDGSKVTLGTYTTNANGQIIIPYVAPGWYVYTEIKAPQGYNLPSNPVTRVYLNPGDNSYTGLITPDEEWAQNGIQLRSGLEYMDGSGEITNWPLNSIVIQKADYATREMLAGATFEVRRVNTNLSGSSGTIVARAITDPSGIIVITGLEAGQYYVIETSPPPNYVLSQNSQQDAYLKADGTSVEILNFYNIPYGSLVVLKTDTVTGKPLPGATFSVTDTAGAVAGNTNGVYVTDANGQFVIYNLKPGDYIVKETKAPDNYALDPVQQTVRIWNEGRIYELRFANQPYGSLVIRKMDEATKEPLANAEFKVTTAGGNAVGSSNGVFKTDTTGTITIPHIPKGSYVIEETKAPDGYILENQSQTLEIDYGKTYTVDFYNKHMSGLQIIKIDSVTKQPLKGAEFAVYKQNGELVGRYTTDADGVIIIYTLSPGWYKVVETKTLPGYVLDGTPKDVEITSNQFIKLVFENAPMSELVIRKIDGDTRQPLEGAEFTVDKADGQRVGIYRTGTDGTTHIPALAPSWYTVTETKAPDGYTLGDNVQTVEITHSKTVTLEFRNRMYGSIVIKKTDEVSGKPLVGADFTVTKQGGGLIGEYTTGADGAVSIPSVEPGWYVISETKAPDGYIISGAAKTIEVKPAIPSVVTFTNKLLTALQIKKIDEQTKEPLTGAKFAVERQNGERVGEYTTDEAGFINIPTLPPDWYVVKETKAPDGYVLDEAPKTIEVKTNTPTVVTFTNKKLTALQIRKIDEQSKEPLTGAKFAVERQNGERIGEYTTDEAGFIGIPTLPPDWYVVKETLAPKGYVIDENPKVVQVKTNAPTVVTFTNKKLTALQIRKVDEKSKEPLAGAKFAIERQTGERVGEYTTDEAGFINIPELAPDWYVVKEIVAPDGYILDEKPKTVEVKTNTPTVVTFTNKLKSGFQITKVDAVSGKPLPGAKFTVYKKSGEVIGEYTTDNNGVIIVDNLPNGWYKIAETKAPKGYALTESAKDIELTGNQFLRIVFENKKLTALQIKKIEAVTGKALPGAKFTVERQTGQRIGEYTTDEAGFINIPELAPDWYVVKEVKAPEGYILDETPKTVEVKTDTPTVVTFTNKLNSGFQIIKVDAVSGKPLPGAKFTVYKKSGEVIGEYTTDNNGVIIVDNLPNGWYKIAETKAPQGYALTESAKDVELTGNQFLRIVFENKKLTSLQIKKIDAVTGKALPGARFTVETVGGQKVYTNENGTEFTTDAQGLINIPNLLPDFYIVREVKAPDGYIIDETPKTVQVKTDVPTVVTFENKPLAGLKIVKINSDTKSPIEGVIFEIAKANGERVTDQHGGYSFKTDKLGQIYIPNLADGYYTVVETKAADGYIIDSEPKSVLVESGKTAVLNLENTPASGLLIIKTDEATGKPLSGVVFDVRKADGQRVQGTILDANQPNTNANSPNKSTSPNGDISGSYTTDATGRILINNIPAGEYNIVETKALDGYIIDTDVHAVTVTTGKLATVKLTNTQKAGLRIRKTDSVTKKPIYNVEFTLYDSNDKVVCTYYTDNNGIVDVDGQLPSGKYAIRETRPADGYYRDDISRTIEFISGKYTEIEWENTPNMGQIQITKKSADDNEINGLPKGTPLQGAIFEVYAYKSGNLIDRFVSGSNGVAVSSPLPLGRYIVKEVQAPQYYKRNEQELDVTIEFATQIIKQEFVNYSANLGVTIKKSGNKQAIPGDTIRYDITAMGNTSTVNLTDFYWRDVLPTDCVRLEKIVTGTYNQSVKYKITATTNKDDTIIITDNLSSTKNNVVGCSAAELGLANDEYITSFTFHFGNVKPGFSITEKPQVFVAVLKGLPNGKQFANKVDVGGKYFDEWQIGNSTWLTEVYNVQTTLPKTGK